MRQAIRAVICSLFLLLLVPLAVQAQDTVPKSLTTQQAPSTTGSVFKELVSAWWLWAGIIVILGLLGLLYYLRNKTED
jgi:hypothetical protein